MSPTIQPGTRCQCDYGECQGARPGTHSRYYGRCRKDATRLVTLHLGAPHNRHEFDVPMCEPCATWHEYGKEG